MPENLAVFDVDGTLTDTADIDSACFAEAVVGEFGIDGFDPDWTSYSEFTDSTIIDEIFEEYFGRRPDAGEIASLVERFVNSLSQAHARRAGDFDPIPGAVALVSTLRDRTGWGVAVATGGWERSARLKLDYAGIDLGGASLAAADDSHLRAGIVTTAIERAGARAGGPFARVVLIGDTLWDVATAARLNLPFLGVGAPERGRALSAAGARAVVQGFRDIENVIELLTVVDPPIGGVRHGRA